MRSCAGAGREGKFLQKERKGGEAKKERGGGSRRGSREEHVGRRGMRGREREERSTEGGGGGRPLQKSEAQKIRHSLGVSREVQKFQLRNPKFRSPEFQGPLNGGVSNGGVSRSGLFCPFLSFLGLSRFFRDFPDLLGDGPGIFPIRPFPLSRPIKSTYEEQSRKGPRHNLDLSRKKWETPGFGNPPV